MEEKEPYMIEPGDILDYAYWYSSCHPHFVKVVRVSRTSAWTVGLPNKVVSSDAYGQSGSVVPDLEAVVDAKPSVHRILYRKNEDQYIKVDGCMTTLWDGKPRDFWSD